MPWWVGALMHPAWGFRGQEGTGWALWLECKGVVL